VGWLRECVTLLELARRRFRSDEHYQQFQAYQGTLLVRFLQQQGVDPKQRLLDLGCGYGGYSRALRAAGAEVIPVDLFRPEASLLFFIRGDALTLPFADDTFPLVFCASLLEHVPHPRLLLKEIKRVLRPGGLAYISFPPFYSPAGGHQFKPYHLLGERLAIRLSGFKSEGYATCFGDWGLYPLSIRQAHRMLGEVGWHIKNMSTRFFPLNVARIPLVGEFLTWHVQFVVCKPPNSPDISPSLGVQ
jgi:SAM-dependent methyltransferase